MQTKFTIGGVTVCIASLFLLQGNRDVPVSVQSVAELATLGYQPLDNFHGRVVRVHDRGGFDVRYDKDSTATVDNGFVFAAPQGRFIAVNQDVANVIQFGAIPGDGQTDFTAIQAAVNTGKPVFVPVADFHTNLEIELQDGSKIYGCGTGSKIIALTSANIFGGNGDDKIEIDNLHLVGYGADVSGDITVENGLYFQSCDNIVVRNCEFENFSSTSCQIRSCKNTQFLNNFCHDAGVNADSTVSTDFLSWGSNTGIIVKGNRCVSDVSQNIYTGALPGDRSVIIEGNYCDTLDANSNPMVPVKKRHSIIAAYQISNFDPIGITVANNICRNTKWTGIYCQGSANSVNITGNICDTNAQDPENSLGSGIHVVGGSPTITASGNINITGNTVINCQKSVNLAEASIRVALGKNIDDRGGRVLISSNQIIDSKCPGIHLTNAAGSAQIVNNSILFPVDHGILVTNNPDQGVGDGLIQGNRIEVDGVTRGIFLDDENKECWNVTGNVLLSRVILDGAFDASAGMFPDARADQILIVGVGGVIDGLTMTPGDWVQSQSTQATTALADEWALMTQEGDGLTDAAVTGIYSLTNNLSVTNNVIRGFASAVYFPTSFTTRSVDPPRIYCNQIRDCHGGVVIRGSGTGLVPVSASNRFDSVESMFGDTDGGGYTAGGVLGELRGGGRIRFDSTAIPSNGAQYIKGDIADNSDFDDGEASSWHFDGTWRPLTL